MVYLGPYGDDWPVGVVTCLPEQGRTIIHGPYMEDFDAHREGEQALCSKCGSVVWEILGGMLRMYPGTLFYLISDVIEEHKRLCAGCADAEGH